jgi:HSP20 family protein
VQSIKHKTYSKDDSYLLEFAAPGYEKDEIKISVNGDVLTLSVDIKKSDETFWKTSFNEKFRIPKDADGENIKAKLDKGILTVEVFKMKEEKSLKTIKID